jgi:uncharacterized membrane protein
MSNFLPIDFQSKAYLWGLAAALIPLVIHLSRSRRTKKIRFSTTRFFTDQFLRSYRMSRLRELLLLACRMLLFALFATALAAPLYTPKERAPGGSAGGSRAVVLVLDNSASMGYVERGQTLLDRARKAARTVLDGLRGGDTASVVLAARRPAESGPEVLFAPPTGQLNDVRQAIDRLAVAPLGTDLTAAVGRAEALAAASAADSREVYVFSDLQESGWEKQTSADPSDPSRVSFVFVGVRPARASNRAVTAVQLAAPRPMVGVPFAFRPLVSLSGDDAAEARVRLYVDGELVSERTVEKQANGHWALPRFHHTFQTAGWHSGYVEVEDPALPQDNQRFFAVEVLQTVKVLAVDGAPSQVPHQDELFFLRLALTASPEGQKAPIDVDTIAPADLAGAEVGKYRLVVLANVESLPAAAVEKLEDFVAGGGSLLVFLGDKVNAGFYNEALAGSNRRFGGLLPCQLVKIDSNPAPAGEQASIGAVDFRHPALAPFQEPRNGALVGGGITFRAFWRVQAPGQAVLMWADDLGKSPLLCGKAFGKGRVMLFASTCDRDWTNFPIRPVFLPWTHQLVAYLAQQPGAARPFHEAGALVRIAAPAGDPAAPVLVKKPDGKVATAERGTEEDPVFLFNEAAQPGIYTVLAADQKAAASLFAVNLDPYESDLTYLDDVLADDGAAAGERTEKVEAGLKALLGRPLVRYVADPDRVGELAAGGGSGRQLWDYFLMVVLLIGLLEPWLANRISARMYGKARAAPQVALPLPGVPATPEPAPAAELVEGPSR